MAFLIARRQQGNGFAVRVQCAFILELHQPRKFGRGVGRQNILLRHAEALQIFLRQVNAPHPRVFAHVADNVGELQRQAQRFRVLQRLRAVEAQNPRNQPPHHAGHAVAVVTQIVKRGITDVVQIHFHSVDDFGQFLFRQGKGGADGFQGLADGMFGHFVGGKHAA